MIEGTYSQIHLHIVFAVRGRQKLLNKSWRDELFRCMNKIIQDQGQKPNIVNGVEDHVHILLGLRPAMNVSNLVKSLKSKSTLFVKRKKKINNFSLQEGYGVFSYSKSQVPKVYNYIENQEFHHQRKSYDEEYSQILKINGLKPFSGKFPRKNEDLQMH